MSVIEKEEVLKVVQAAYGLSGKVSNLGSCQDINFKFTDAATGSEYVVKFTDAAMCTELEIDFQHAVITYLASCDCGDVAFPIPMVASSGSMVSDVTIGEKVYRVRMLKFVRGNILSDYKYFSAEVLKEFGAFVGMLTLKMTGFEGAMQAQTDLLKVANREIEWDLRRAEHVIDGFLPSFLSSTQADEVARRALFLSQYERAKEGLRQASSDPATGASQLRTQILHGDLAHYNVVAQTNNSGRPYVTGVIDFGDAMCSWTVAELAVAVVSGFAADNTNSSALEETCAVLRGFISVYPLNEWEIAALWPLVILRSMVNILCIRSELEENPTNQYNLDGLAVEWAIFDRIAAVPIALALETLRWAAGLPASAACLNAASALRSVQGMFGSQAATHVLDLSVQSQLLQDGAWESFANDAECLRAVVQAQKVPASENLFTAFACPYGVPLLHRANKNCLTEPDSVALGVTVVFVTRPDEDPSRRVMELRAPFDCVLASVKELKAGHVEVVLKHASGLALTVKADAVYHTYRPIDGKFAAGDDVLVLLLTSTVHVQLACYSLDGQHADQPAAPEHCTAHTFPVWRRICPSPLALLGLPVDEAAEESEEEQCAAAVATRTQHVASVQEHYFRRPPRIERGWRQHLYSPTGRGYLDMVNNVAVLGHCHPSVYAAATAQMRLLNTNSRFIYEQLGKYANKIIATMPANAPNLNAVFFVNSGSEATDLAMRIARTVATYHRNQREAAHNTGKTYPFCRDTICLEGAYHGVTTASDEVSTTLNDNPHALSSRADWIHLVPMPNPLRGKFPYESLAGQPSAGERYADFVTEKIRVLSERDRIPACFIAEPLSGNAGGVELPPGYLKRAYAEVRAAGGLCIADEVQVGYGRLGTHFWGFLEHDVVPDILTMAKAAGNGHPLGFVVTSKENAAIFGTESGSFFSSAGGGPVSCAIGCAVLDAIAAENLQENAATVGAYLNTRLNELAAKNRHIIGCIHGHGLYQGIELVRGEASLLRPSAAAAEDSANRGKVPATAEAYAVCERLLSLGVICHNTGDYSNVLKVKPPLCLTMQDADFFVQALEICLRGW